ncbi:hypothetical protein ACFVJI_10010 [Streptomyces sp. NPDC127584]|uniref:hypothetical protein n=1 Tax=Streptomyces sp. NPDC127584 TaxID=3345403 RepID=UPI003640D3A5
MIGEVVGCRPFGGFTAFDHAPEAIGPAEITATPRNAVLPPTRTRVSGDVIWHAGHNHQVKIRLDDWKAST